MDSELRKKLYYEMLRIRMAEEGVADNYSKEQMKCPVHLSIGQEAVPVGICAQLTSEDRVFSNHRCHAHYLAAGGGIPEMIAELSGKITGCAKGKGGSMHLVAPEKGMMGASALVGGTIGMATGTALSIKQSGSDRVSVAFFGDGGTEEGIFYESMNFAMLHKLPVIFACENNMYATYSHQKARQATMEIARRGESFGIASAEIDGNDVEAVYRSATEAIARARTGQGPTVIEFKTYRWRDHVGPGYDIKIGYRTQQELDAWMAKCPIDRLGKKLVAEKILSESELKEMAVRLRKEVEAAFDFAENSPLPKPTELLKDVYA